MIPEHKRYDEMTLAEKIEYWTSDASESPRAQARHVMTVVAIDVNTCGTGSVILTAACRHLDHVSTVQEFFERRGIPA